MQQLVRIVEILNNHGDYWAELGNDRYLIRFNRRDNDENNLVLMGDLGITWEPFRAYPTPRYCSITIENTEQAAKNLMKLADCYKSGELLQEWVQQDLGLYGLAVLATGS